MSLDLPVFDLRSLQKSFYLFFIANLIMAIIGYLFQGSLYILIAMGYMTSSVTWIILLALCVPSFLFSYWTKKELAKINSLADTNEQIEKYQAFYKKRLLWNLSSIAITVFFLLINGKRMFLYLLIIQLVLSLVFFPNKKIIGRELKNPGIVFT